MHVLLPAEEGLEPLRSELGRVFPGSHVHHADPDLLLLDSLPPGIEAPPALFFARQVLPDARLIAAPSIRALADALFEALLPLLPENQPWRLHVEPHYGQGDAGRHRCQLIVESLRERLQRQRRHLLRRREIATTPFRPTDSLVQLLLTEPGQGFLSVAPAPLPFAHRLTVSPFPQGTIPVASDKAAPSRAFAKLVEAEQRLGLAIGPGDTCVDLGASPGSWTYVALQRGARVTAVDRSPLRPDLHRHPALTFHEGDAFRFMPEQPVDWLLCDVIAAPARNIELLFDWIARRRCRRFVVTIKFKGTEDYAQLDRLRQELPSRCGALVLTRLCANKNEACAAGVVAAGDTDSKSPDH